MEPTTTLPEKELWRWQRLEQLLSEEESIFAKLKSAPTEEEKKECSRQLKNAIQKSRQILAEK